jgi:glycosyltransferase involved in cell wall biosynthesis
VRLVHLAGYDGPYAGSFIPMVRAALRAARAEGWEVEAAFTASARGRPWLEDLERDGVPWRIAPAAGRRGLAQWVSDLLAEDPQLTVLHTHFTAFDLPAVVAARKRRETTRVVWHVHSRLAPGGRGSARAALKNIAFGRFPRRILCVAPDIAHGMRRRLAPRSTTRFLANAVDTEAFPYVTAERRAAAREALGLPHDARVLMHLGWDWHRKGGDLFLEAAAMLGRSEDVVPVTVGAGEEARALGEALGLEGLRILEPTGQVQDLYAAADVLVSPSRAEGMPFAVAEALCCGVGVVASRIPGQVAIGADIRACRLTALEAGEIAEVMTATLDRNPEEIAGEGRDARATIVARMDLEPWAQRLLDVYSEIVGSEPGGIGVGRR